jgi:hypothetical protein
MNLDDESLLSAFLDGELEPAQQLRIEAVLLEDPRLAERIQELAAVRMVVGSLPRPTVEVDLAPAVCARIETSPGFRIRRALRSSPVRSRLLTAGVVLATAAALLVAVAPSFTPRPAPDPRATAPGEYLVATQPAAASPSADEPAVAAPAPLATPPVAAAVLDDPRALAHRERFRSLLDSPSVRQLTILVDSLSPGELAKVEGALNETGRAQAVRGEIRIGQGIVIDPDRPGEAVVYLVVMDGREAADFRKNLDRQGAPEIVRDEEARPEVVTQLADLGGVLWSDGSPVPGLRTPPDHLGGTLAQRDPALESGPLVPGGSPAPEELPIAEQPGPAPADDPTHGPRRVYLVWVMARCSDPHESHEG